MGETLIGKIYGLAPDKLPEAHQILTASTAIKRTPYQLDLVTKDRKPDIVPKVGDKVKIKSREWYERWSDEYGEVRIGCTFVKDMKDYCGRTMTISEVSPLGNYRFKGVNYYFSLDMFEEVYPVQKQINSPFPKIDFNSKADFVEKPLTIPPFSLNGGELIVAKTTIDSMIKDTAKRLSAYTLDQGLGAKPKLKQIKTTRLIKLKKL